MNLSCNLRKATIELKSVRSGGQSTLLTNPDIRQALRKMALFLAETWEYDRSEAHSDSEEDLEACVLQVTVEMSTAAKAVGGVSGIAVLTGGGSEAAQFACKQVLRL